MTEQMTIALYKDSSSTYNCTFIKDCAISENGDYWENHGYVRVTEPITIDFEPREQTEIDRIIVAEIDKEIAETVVKYEEKLNELKSRKALLVALPAE